MAGILVIAEARRGELREVSLELITAVLSVKDAAGGPLAVALVDSNAAALAPALAADGVAEAARTALIEARAPALVLVGHTIDSMGFAPAVAARVGTGFASDVVGLAW